MTPLESNKDDLGLTLGMLILRLWLSVRALQSGLEKFAGTSVSSQAVQIDGAPDAYGLTEATTSKVYALSYHQGVPAALYEKFAAEPLLPAWGLALFNSMLGPVLILLGLSLLLGFATRVTLFAMGLIYTGLTFGLILLKQDAGVAWLGIHILLIVAALVLAKHNRLNFFKRW